MRLGTTMIELCGPIHSPVHNCHTHRPQSHAMHPQGHVGNHKSTYCGHEYFSVHYHSVKHVQSFLFPLSCDYFYFDFYYHRYIWPRIHHQLPTCRNNWWTRHHPGRPHYLHLGVTFTFLFSYRSDSWGLHPFPPGS